MGNPKTCLIVGTSGYGGYYNSGQTLAFSKPNTKNAIIGLDAPTIDTGSFNGLDAQASDDITNFAEYSLLWC